MRWWYLRRGVAWLPVLSCCVAAGVAALVLQLWPSTALVLLPTLLAACAAAGAYLFDEPPLAVVTVTPRGALWRGTARLSALLVPLGLWVGVVAARPGDLVFDRPGWLLAGGAAILLATGLAAATSRRDVPAPGATLGGAVALSVIAPVVAAGFIGFDTPYPLAGFSEGVRSFWLLVAAVAVLACAGALRPGIRR